MNVENGALEKLLSLLSTSASVPEHVSRRFRANWVRERVESHESVESTREFQIEHYEIRVELDIQMRRDGTKPAMVGFESMLSALQAADDTVLEFHLLMTQGGAFLVCTDRGTSRLIGLLWDFDERVDPYP